MDLCSPVHAVRASNTSYTVVQPTAAAGVTLETLLSAKCHHSYHCLNPFHSFALPCPLSRSSPLRHVGASADGFDFLHPDNVCGRTLLTLVARGSAILAELLRLSDHIPPALTSPDSKYCAQSCTTSATSSLPSCTTRRSTQDVALTELDEEFRESHSTLLERFYRLFESVYRYYSDWVVYLEELHEGVFVQHTIENVLEDREGGQLMCEALYLYGCMLLLLDRRIEGSTRGRRSSSLTTATRAWARCTASTRWSS